MPKTYPGAERPSSFQCRSGKVVIAVFKSAGINVWQIPVIEVEHIPDDSVGNYIILP